MNESPPLTGKLQKWSSFWEDTEENGYDSVVINVNHPIKLTRIAIQALLSKNKKGVVCILASVAGLAGTYGVPLYCATKHAMVGFVKSMKLCDELEGVKITAICPWYALVIPMTGVGRLRLTVKCDHSAVRTPLWTNQPEKMVQFGLNESESVTPMDVGEAILSLVEDGQYEGGTVMEITPYGTRVIPEWNVSQPPTKLTGIISQEDIDRNLAPIKEKLQKERLVEC